MLGAWSNSKTREMFLAELQKLLEAVKIDADHASLGMFPDVGMQRLKCLVIDGEGVNGRAGCWNGGLRFCES